jgi:hypothetical protein
VNEGEKKPNHHTDHGDLQISVGQRKIRKFDVGKRRRLKMFLEDTG